MEWRKRCRFEGEAVVMVSESENESEGLHKREA